jgi:hypothetical protein
MMKFVSDAGRLQGMPQLSGAHFSIVEWEDVPDMVKAMVEQEADMNRASEDVGNNVASLATLGLPAFSQVNRTCILANQLKMLRPIFKKVCFMCV